MPNDNAPTGFRRLYATLLRFYPQPYRKRFGKGMEQTFNDLYRERAVHGDGVLAFAVWAFADTAIGIVKENIFSIFHFLGMTSKNFLRPALGTIAILLIPLVAMQFTSEVDWGIEDFVVMGTLLFGMGLAYEFIASRSDNVMYKAAIGLAALTSLGLVWVTLAVGIIGDDNPANLFYLGVPVVGFVGAAAAAFEPRGMARAAFATALVQFLIPVVALFLWSPQEVSWAPGVLPVFMLNTCIAMMYVAAGLLFRNAALGHK